MYRVPMVIGMQHSNRQILHKNLRRALEEGGLGWLPTTLGPPPPLCNNLWCNAYAAAQFQQTRFPKQRMEGIKALCEVKVAELDEVSVQVILNA